MVENAHDRSIDRGRHRGSAAGQNTGGPFDSQGRSLRQFDLQTRMFKYPCSYLIYSESLNALPAEAKKVLFARLREVLSGKDQSKDFAHLSNGDRKAIREILMSTKPELGLEWGGCR